MRVLDNFEHSKREWNQVALVLYIEVDGPSVVLDLTIWLRWINPRNTLTLSTVPSIFHLLIK